MFNLPSLIPGAVSCTDDHVAIIHRNQPTNEHHENPGDTKEERQISFKNLLSNFAATTTAHGVGRIAAASNLPKRVLWCVVSVGLYTAMFWMCTELVLLYVDKPVVSRMETSFEESLDFPAVTICNLNMLKASKINKNQLHQLFKELEKRRLDRADDLSQHGVNTSKVNSTEESIQRQIDELKTLMKESLLSKAKSSAEKEVLSGVSVDTLSLDTAFLDMILKSVPEEELTKTGHGLNEMLKHCRWLSFSCGKGSLRGLWRHFWHWKYGNCFVFNSGLAQNGSKLPVMKVDKAGPYSGLEMDIFINQGEYTALTDEAGVRVVLTDQTRMPFPFHEGFSVPTGFSTSVGIKKRYIQRVDPYLNNSCIDENKAKYRTDIYKEKYHVNYSCQACRMSCLASKQVETCNCSEPRFPTNSYACLTVQQYQCIRQVEAKFTALGQECDAKCPQPCLENVFSYTVSSSRWSRAFNTLIKRKYLKMDSVGNALLARLKISLLISEASWDCGLAVP